MRRLTFVTALLIATAFLLAGCLAAQHVKTQDLPIAPPWHAPEALPYVVLDRNKGKELLRGTFEVAAKNGLVELSQKFHNAKGDYDNRTVLVSPTTLKPVSGTLDTRQDNKRRQLKSSYDPATNVVTITEIEATGDRPLPHRLMDHYYDNDSVIFVWRSLRFVEGFTANFHTVVTGRAEQWVVHIAVTRKERITVPAGTFDTWRLEIQDPQVKQVAWYADTPLRPLVQYDNSIQLFQLLSLPKPATAAASS